MLSRSRLVYRGISMAITYLEVMEESEIGTTFKISLPYELWRGKAFFGILSGRKIKRSAPAR
jgi:hypothetical protein